MTILCYAQQDERMVNQFKNHLSPLEHNGYIVIRDHSDIGPGAVWEQELDKYFSEAQMILLLISPSFLASNYCYRVEMQRAIGRHELKEARVIPIILRPVHWNEPPIDKLQALPTRAKPISRWTDRDDGFKNVVDGIVQVIKQWNTHTLSESTAERRALIASLDQLIEAVKSQVQPPPRAMAIAATLQQLSIFVPNDVTLADLVVGWQTLSHPAQKGEDPATSQRRVTCGELANMASLLTTDQGNPTQAIKTWHIWSHAFKNSNDPRQTAMARTFARELTELQNARH